MAAFEQAIPTRHRSSFPIHGSDATSHALPVAVFVVLCAASLTAEVMRVRTAASDIQSHQARWNCLALESGKVPRCVELAKRRPEDADYCEEAVSKCTALGMYRESADADQRHLMWDRLGAWLRVLLETKPAARCQIQPSGCVSGDPRCMRPRFHPMRSCLMRAYRPEGRVRRPLQ